MSEPEQERPKAQIIITADVLANTMEVGIVGTSSKVYMWGMLVAAAFQIFGMGNDDRRIVPASGLGRNVRDIFG